MNLDKKTLIALKEHAEDVRVVSGTAVSKVTPEELEFVFNSPLAEAPHTEMICLAVIEWLEGLIEQAEIDGK